MIELKEYQKQAADQIAERFARYYDEPPMRGTRKNPRVVPFFQSLHSITASGKTVILADAVATIATLLPLAPVVLWLSKGKVVVDQTSANLAPGGKYHHLLGAARFGYLAQYDQVEVRDAEEPLVFFATVGTFNQKDKEEGSRLVFKSEIDTAEASTWDALKLRVDGDGRRRPLVIVYDEAHNLTDQQMGLLLELEPDGLITASATMKLPTQLGAEIKHLKDEGWTDADLVTDVDAKAVADSGLVKSQVHLGGYEAPMEETINSLIADLRETQIEAFAHGVGAPKAIYVCKTNIVEGNSLQMDDPHQPFLQRRSPPILIWRHLTEQCNVEPESVAVYCSLKTHKDYPLPPDFHLFKGGDKDYDLFIANDYQHVIFNLSLQEGWDDPLVYFGYVDKSMESNIQVEQIVGRLLRQPGGKRYPSERLNSAHFYIRVDKRGVFSDILEEVNKRLSKDAPGIKLVESKPGRPKPEAIPAKTVKRVYETAYITDHAIRPIADLIDGMIDFRNDDGSNIRSAGGRTLIQRFIGDDSDVTFEWEEFEHTNLVVARWLFQREVMRRFQGALGVAPTDAPKFDARIGFGSPAHKEIQKLAADVVDAYIDNVYLKQKSVDEYVVGPALVRRDEMEAFTNALHEGYSGLNESLELPFARAIDKTGLPWYRNPSRSGYNIPLITLGTTRNFYPDFLVWSKDNVFAIDTTGKHLLADKTGRKLLSIAPPKGEAGRLVVRFLSEGTWNARLEPEDPAGYTVWSQKQDGSLRATAAADMDDAVARALAELA
ncbi:DEAD/DEAH box helicase family protein [Miltoncostaea marina]|uniref:DEAD/DEAH box helicase family protein n=1 Tax=Miltoncostaea marina TaxID=2843215 RepID=UPI001C3DF963|nr:DEAD/DEAH box helicase family protein [Miltoncostaea marina]